MDYSFIAVIGVAIASCFVTYDKPEQPEYHVAIIDRFYPGDDYYRDEEERLLHTNLHGLLDLDRDRLREPFYHGEIVSILASHPQIEIHRYAMQPDKHPQKEILRQLKNVRKHVFWGEPINAVVLSWSPQHWSVLLSSRCGVRMSPNIKNPCANGVQKTRFGS